MARRIRLMALWLATAAVTFAGLELLLYLLAALSAPVDGLLRAPWDPDTYIIPDARLGSRPKPSAPGHDAKGFRNVSVPVRSDAVALGDSQTYGTGVPLDQTWPKRVESMIGKTVYSMAYPGWGPGQSLLLWEEAMALHPHVVLEAFYSGNDLFDVFHLVYDRGQLIDLKIADPSTQQAITIAEKREPLSQKVERFNMMDGVAAPPQQAGSSGLRVLLQYSKTYGLLRRLRYEVTRDRRAWDERGNNWSEAQRFVQSHPECCETLDVDRFQTVLTPAYRHAALDLSDPRITEGLRMSLEIFRVMQARSTAEKARFIVVLIPTKELVFLAVANKRSEAYQALIQDEEAMWNATKSFLDTHGIEYVDTLPALREQLVKGPQPYLRSREGHPNSTGHAAIAGAVAAKIRQHNHDQ